MTVERLGFLGIRVAGPDPFTATVALYGPLELPVIAEVAGHSA